MTSDSDTLTELEATVLLAQALQGMPATTGVAATRILDKQGTDLAVLCKFPGPLRTAATRGHLIVHGVQDRPSHHTISCGDGDFCSHRAMGVCAVPS